MAYKAPRIIRVRGNEIGTHPKNLKLVGRG